MAQKKICDFFMYMYSYDYGLLLGQCMLKEYCVTEDLRPLVRVDRQLCSLRKRFSENGNGNGNRKDKNEFE